MISGLLGGCSGASCDIWNANHCLDYNHHKDLVNPGMGQSGHGCTMLQKMQEKSFLLTLAVQIGGVAFGQDL